MTNKDFVSYEIAKMLKNVGFDWPCSHYYTKENASDGDVWLTTAAFSPEDWNNDSNSEPDFLKPLCAAPSLWEAQKWLRDVKNIIILINYDDYAGWTFFSPHRDIDNNNPYCESYESALCAGIEAALKLIEEGKR